MSYAASINPSVPAFTSALFSHRLVITISTSSFFVRIVHVGVFVPRCFLIQSLCFWYFLCFLLPLLLYFLVTISFGVRSSCLANLLLAFLIQYFFFCFSCAFTYCNIQSVVESKYFSCHEVVVLLVNSCFLSCGRLLFSYCDINPSSLFYYNYILIMVQSEC